MRISRFTQCTHVIEAETLPSNKTNKTYCACYKRTFSYRSHMRASAALLDAHNTHALLKLKTCHLYISSANTSRLSGFLNRHSFPEGNMILQPQFDYLSENHPNFHAKSFVQMQQRKKSTCEG
jgi:hypothetical protein